MLYPIPPVKWDHLIPLGGLGSWSIAKLLKDINSAVNYPRPWTSSFLPCYLSFRLAEVITVRTEGGRVLTVCRHRCPGQGQVGVLPVHILSFS